MMDVGLLIAGLCVGAVFGLRVGEAREARQWRFHAHNPQSPAPMVSGATAYFVMRTSDFYEHWHNPLVRALRRPA